ncbi:hypothetical protein GGR51DRAFT_258262 [Nemania sp. FL0031]|nr:hypothetical protein GGR51DRAFT_258262 [Nemania sp. FL0031]
MRVTTFIQRTVVLLGLVAIVATSARAQTPSFGGVTGWGGNNPFNSDPDNNNNNNNESSSNANGSGSGSDNNNGGGTGTGGSSNSGGGSESGSNEGNGIGGNNNSGTFGGGGDSDPSEPNFGGSFGVWGDEYASFVSYRTAHGVLAAFAFAVLFPSGGILIRLVPGRAALLAHAGIQLLAYALYIAAAGLGIYMTSMIRLASGASPLDRVQTNAHPIIGIALLVLLFSQPVSGFIHHRQFKKAKRRSRISYVHLWVGRVSITLGIINGGLGLALAGTRGAPVVAYAVISGVMWLLWVLAALFGAYKRATAERDRLRKMEKIIQEDRGFVPGIRGGGRGYGADTPPVEDAAPGSQPRALDGSGLAPPPPVALPMDMPSPPYTPGPHYAAHMAHVQQQQQQQSSSSEMGATKEAADRYDSVSIMSASSGEMHRGQV